MEEKQTDEVEESEMAQPRSNIREQFFERAPGIVDHWLQCLADNHTLAPSFRGFWKEAVPLVFELETTETDSLDWCYSEHEPMLFQLLEKFMCGGSINEMLDQLSTPPLCGRMFKFGEPTYACRECGVDGTCVFCAQCFKQSVHQHHKYKMSKSPGGGRCDCGDVEAWKSDPYCDFHLQGLKSQANGKKFPEEIAKRSRIVFDIVLSYAFELLTLKYSVSLPSDLKQTDETPLRMDLKDKFCIVLYNDEAHTFEQVFEAMNKVMKSDHRDLNDMVTRVDREGRAVIKCANFTLSSELKLELEKCTSRQNNQPLKVQVLHMDVVAHQVFALKLLDWMQKIVQLSEGFRNVFASVVLESSSSQTMVEKILMEDANMWKAARTAWHKLFMSGLLMEYESKKALARVFTKKYGSITKEYIRDDHDRHVSIASLSVQLFTVPTLAHYLIAEERALFILWNTFLSECQRKVIDKKLVFERNSSTVHFRRAMEVLADVKFLLSVQPKEWTDGLRLGFLSGLSPMVDLMVNMQDMDPVKRQVGQHVEYEPEWETGFLLHMKMASIATQVAEWCGSDKVVLIKAYRLLLTKLYEAMPDTKPHMVTQELADHSANCQVYDVSTKPVSIHLPLTRVLASLHLYLEKHGLTFDSPELGVLNKPSPQQLLEPVVRLQVMIAQVHAGMWRRNGYSLITQIGLYHGVKCRTEMLDRDIVMLQIGASLIESNEFLILLLHKFNLLHWANPYFERNPDEDGMRRTINLVEEFLGLLVTIVGERFTPGVGRVSTEEQTKKEIIQQLCIRPLSHSDLYTTFPYEEMLENGIGIEAVIDQVADFKKPGNRKGVYELKERLYSEYNVFYYHYTREERSKSEEKQRKRNKARDDLDCCPPPQLPQLTESFSMLANLLQCDVMLHLLHTVLSRAADLRAQSFSEVQLHKALHLMGYALQEQEREPEGFLLFTERAERWRLERLLEELVGSARVEALKGMIKWVLAKYRAVKKSRQPRATPAEPVAVQTQAEYLAGKDKEWRAKMAAEKRAKIMAQMAAMQKNFMKENATMFQDVAEDKGEEEDRDMDQDPAEWSGLPVALGRGQTPPSLQSQSHTCILCQENETVSTTGPALVLAAYVQKSAVLGRRTSRRGVHDPENCPLFLPSVLHPAPHTSTCGHVMHASCWKHYFENVMTKENRRPYRLRQPASFDIENKEFLCPLCACLSNTVLPLLPPLPSIVPSRARSQDVSFRSWFMDLQRGPQSSKTSGNQGVDSLSGVVTSGTAQDVTVAGALPNEPVKLQLSRSLQDQALKDQASSTGPDAQGASTTQGQSMEVSVPPLQEEQDADSDTESPGARRAKRVQLEPKEGSSKSSKEVVEVTSEPTVELSEDLVTMINEFMRACYEKNVGLISDDADKAEVPIMAWQSCAYTIRSLEVLLRDEGKPLMGHMSSRQHDCLQSLVRMMGMVTTAWRRPSCVHFHAHTLFTVLVNTHPNTGCVLDWDSFGMLVPIVFLLAKTPVPVGNGYESHGLRIALVSEIVKYLLSINFKSEQQNWNFGDSHHTTSSGMDVDESPEEEHFPIKDSDINVINEFLTFVLQETKRSVECLPNPKQLWERVMEACRPFLRCAVLFFHFLTSVPTPPAFDTLGGDTFESMCAYLGITESWEDLLLSDTMKALIKQWTSHPRVQMFLKDEDPLLWAPPLQMNRFVSLPEDYSELMNSVSEFYCRKWVESRNPTMCLVCGEMLCSQNFCCQRELGSITVGACTYHAATCGAGCGIFLRVRECEILLLALPNRGTFMTSPYVDDYGETDQGLRRGYRLRLCPDLYRDLERLWLSHGIREYVSRSIDRGTAQIVGQWHQF